MTRMSPELWERIPPDAQAIFLEMAGTIKRLERRVDELERRLGKTPQNSSLPPSSQHPHAKPAPRKAKSKRKPGGQPGHKKHQRALVPPERVNETVSLKPDHCRRCGERLRGSDPDPLRHQVWELPEIRPIITESRRHRLMCACRDLFNRFDELWLFLEHPGVEPTNNAAAPRGYPALRHAVIWRKLSFGTKSDDGSRFVERLLSVIETCRQQDRAVLPFVMQAVERHFAHRRPPSLLRGV